MIVSYVFVGCLAALSAVVHAQDDSSDEPLAPSIFDSLNTPFTFTECAAPAEMKTCWNAQNITTDNNDDGDCPALEQRIACVLTNCWNRVYSCDYEQLALAYGSTCSDYNMAGSAVAVNLPFYPPPSKAAGQCSCNLDTLHQDLNATTTGLLRCAEKVRQERGEKEDDDFVPLPDCACCFYGSAAATMWDICPDQNPGPLGLDVINQMYIGGGAINGNNSLSECASRLADAKFNCTDYGFDTYGNTASDYARPTPLHSATGTFSDLPGVITSPVSGATYTWTALNSTYTITAASVEAVATRTASASQGVTGSVTGTAIGAPSTASSSGAAAPTMVSMQRPELAILGLSGLAFALL